jgi:membrane glycosyltransferase
MEAVRTSETSVRFYQTTRRNKPEDSNLHRRRCENMKSQVMTFYHIHTVDGLLFNSTILRKLLTNYFWYFLFLRTVRLPQHVTCVEHVVFAVRVQALNVMYKHLQNVCVYLLIVHLFVVYLAKLPLT